MGAVVFWASAATLACTARLGSIRLAGLVTGLGFLFLWNGNDQFSFLRNKTILALIFHDEPPSFSSFSGLPDANEHR